MCLSIGLDAALEQTVVHDPVRCEIASVEQPQLLPDAFSICAICAVFDVRVLAEETSPKDHQRSIEVFDDENIGEGNPL